MRRYVIAGLFAFAVFLGVASWGPPSHGQTDTTAPRYQVSYGAAPVTTYRAASASADTADIFSMAALTRIQNPFGHPNLRVSARFTTASATATLTMVRGIPSPFNLWTPGDHTSLTATAPANAGGSIVAGALFVAPGLLFDMTGTPVAVIAVTAISAGSVTLVIEGPF